MAFVDDRLAPCKRPSRGIVTDALLAAPTGEILKAKLIETFAAELTGTARYGAAPILLVQPGLVQ